MEINEQQYAQWLSYTKVWENRVRPKVRKAILYAEIARDFQRWLDVHGVLFPTVFTNEDNKRITELVDVYNRIDRANSKVEDGVYGLKFEGGIMDIIAPVHMHQEQYQEDRVTGFGVHPLIWVGVIGAVIVGAVVAISALVKSISENTIVNTERKLVEAHKEIAELSPEMQNLYANMLDDKKEKLKEAGLLDKLLGSGSGGMIAAALAIGVILYAYSRRG